MTTIRTQLYLTSLLLMASVALCAKPLEKDSPEFKQIIAMGYELVKDIPNDDFTIVSNGDDKILLGRSDTHLLVARLYKRKAGLSEKEELELLRLVNKMNSDLSYQVIVSDDTTLMVALYDFGSYQPKTFAKLIRMIEKADIIFDSYPALLKLVN